MDDIMLATEFQFDFFKKQKNDLKPFSKGKKIYIGIVSALLVSSLIFVMNMIVAGVSVSSINSDKIKEIYQIKEDKSLNFWMPASALAAS